MSQREIPCLLMRGGSSRGPVFLRDDLPAERDELARALAAAVGAGHPLTIDGLGGGAPVTTKVVMLSRSERADADIDYFFAQVQPASALVDFAPTCGNMLAAVGPAAVETGLVAAADGETRLRILAINTGALVESVVQTPGGRVEYAGAATVDGVPGTAAPVRLDFMNVVGSGTGVLFPTGARRDVVGGVEATCIDVAVPMVLARAGEFGLTGYESPAEIDADAALRARMERVRIEAGERMGLGDVSSSVVPKFGLLSPPRAGGLFCARYFTPWDCHPAMAVTGAICMTSCVLCPGTVADGLADVADGGTVAVGVEHPQGLLEVVAEYGGGEGFELLRAGIVRTARLIMRGHVALPF